MCYNMATEKGAKRMSIHSGGGNLAWIHGTNYRLSPIIYPHINYDNMVHVFHLNKYIFTFTDMN